MNITFIHKGAHIEVAHTGMPGHAKLYAVPTEYSPDGYYVAVWQNGELEPMPGCAVNEASLLCHAQIERDENGGASLKVLTTNEGVSCHA